MLNVDSGGACSVVVSSLAIVQPTEGLPRFDRFRVVAVGPTAAHGMLWKHWYNPNVFFFHCQALLSAIYQPSCRHVSSAREVLIACN